MTHPMQVWDISTDARFLTALQTMPTRIADHLPFTGGKKEGNNPTHVLYVPSDLFPVEKDIPFAHIQDFKNLINRLGLEGYPLVTIRGDDSGVVCLLRKEKSVKRATR